MARSKGQTPGNTPPEDHQSGPPDVKSTGPEGRGIVAWFANNHAAANILMIFFIMAGLGTVTSMVRETFPTIDPRIISITVPFPGASPEDVESGITRRIEEAVIGVQGVERVESNAQEGVGSVTIELEEFVDGDEVLSDIETEVDAIQDFPPENAEDLSIVKVKARGDVLTLVVHGDVEPIVLRDWAEIIEDQLLSLPTVSLASISGTPEREISIEISEDQLRQYDLTLGQVAEIVQAFTVDLPAGTLRTNSAEILVRVQERRYYGSEFTNIVIRSNPDGSLLRLGDIATIRDGFADKDVLNLYNGQPAVFVDISRSESQDVLRIEQEIRAYVKSLELPEEIGVSVWKNQTDILKDRISLLARNAILGYALVFVALLLFLDLKLAFWTSLGIPISFLGGIFIASLFGVSMNMISLFALIVVLGIVVDDAIVTGESIFTEQEKGGSHPTQRGVNLIKAPVTIGVLTTIAAFSPLVFSTGTLGQILLPIPIVVISVLFLSLIEAFLILPAHLQNPTKWSIGFLAWLQEQVSKGLETVINKIIVPFAHTVMAARYVFLLIVMFICALPVFLMASGQIKFIFFPQIESDEIRVSLEMPVGTPYEMTKAYTDQLIQAFEQVVAEESGQDADGARSRAASPSSSPSSSSGSGGPDQTIYKNMAVSIGLSFGNRGGPNSTASSSIASHLSEITVELVPSAQRSISASVLARRWRQNLGEIPQAEKIAFESSLVSGGADINIELSHRDSDVLEAASEQIKRQMQQMELLSEVVDSLEPGKKEFVFELTDAGMAAGLTPLDVGRQLRDAFEGREVDRVQRGSSEVEVTVRYTKDRRESLSTIEDIRLRLPGGDRAPVSVMTTIRERYSPSVIKSVDGRQVVSITADVDKSQSTPDEAIAAIVENFIEPMQDRYPGLSYALAGQNKDQQEDLATLGKNMLIALMIIFVLLTSQLRSYSKPFIIMMAIPMGIAGAIYGHILLGFTLSFVSLFGVVALTGVVINDSVVLVDYYNALLRDNPKMSAHDAAIGALQRRFRPILLTTLTTSLGLLPMLLETSLQAQFIIPMAVSLAMGILFASVMLIFTVPALLVIFEDIEGLKKKCSAQKKPAMRS